ncbi:S8 family serine peptidase [Okeania sp.]|uniref:S8 family serine peptidase n=1 Tax=Okeania sp. TaxID=3100323 RepID=UPI002B4B7571|nr:S8 family serine peptidase [Okeania sp.]MEB3342748.1 S8 family serine peptidase [Okeania sp.]
MDKIEETADLVASQTPLDEDLEDNNEEALGLLEDPTGTGVNGENQNPVADNTPIDIEIEPLELVEGQIVFDFDDISNTSTDTIFGDQQIGDFFWSNDWAVINRDSRSGDGYENGNVSPLYSGFNSWANPVSITSEEDFTFDSAYLTAAWNEGLNIEVKGLNDGNQLYSETVTVDPYSPTLFDFNFVNVDEVQFSSSGGTNAGLGGSGAHFVIDDLVYTPGGLGSISGYKWNDLNGDGIWDSNEEGLAGWTIYIDENNNGQLDAGETSTVTAEDGSYTFEDLIAGAYTIAEVLEEGWEQTYPGFGETVVIDFESLKNEDSGYQNHGFNYEEDGFALNNLSQPYPFAAFGTLERRFSGSTALFNNTVNGITRLSATDNQAFDLVSIDITELNGSNVANVTFVGELEGGGTVTQTFTLDGNAFDPETFVFNDDFNQVVAVEWLQESPYHQFDNITIETGNQGSSMVEGGTTPLPSESVDTSEPNNQATDAAAIVEEDSVRSSSSTEDAEIYGPFVSSGATVEEDSVRSSSSVDSLEASQSDTETTEENPGSEIPLEAVFASGEVIVKLSEGYEISALSSLQESLGATTIKTTKSEELDIQLWSISGAVEEFISNNQNNSAFEYIEPNYIITVDSTVPNDPSFSQLWGLHNTGQTGGTSDADIDTPEAWDIQTGSENVLVGVIDTGIDYTHPDLVDNMWTNPGEIPDNGVDDDNNGYVDDVYGYDFAYDDGDPLDIHSHGTHVAGTIGAKGDDGTGIVGVNWNADLMAIKFLNDGGSGDLFDAVLAVEYATMMGADLTNNSWGGGGFSQGLHDMIAAAGAADSLFVAAAGNDYGRNNDTNPQYPASYDLDNIIAVASTDHNDNLSSFSNIGAKSVDLGAPGSNIYSSIPGGGYASYSGTSMATPHVAGVAALVWSENPELSSQEVKEIILESGDPISALDGKTLTGRRLNAFNAISEVGEPGEPGEPGGLGTHTVELEVGENVTDINFGNREISGFISGYKWNDLDGNSEWDDNEVGLEGWTIYIDENENGELDEGENSTVTDAEGYYEFDGLEIGTYRVAEVMQDGWKQTYPSKQVEVIFEADFSDNENPNLDGFTVDNTGAPTEGLWHLSTRRGGENGHSGVDSMYYGVEETGNYDAGYTAGRIISPVIDLSELDSAQLSFNYFLETEGLGSEYDVAKVLVSVDGGDFVPIASNAEELKDPTTGWTNAEFDLSSYVGQQIEISFEFDTGDRALNEFEGWYIDDVTVTSSEDDPFHTVEVVNGENIGEINFGNLSLKTESVRFDFNADGVADILWRNENGRNAIWMMNENGTRNSSVNPGSVPTVWDVVGVDDFNADGVADILWRNENGSNAIWMMNENGTRNSSVNPGSVPTVWDVAGM